MAAKNQMFDNMLRAAQGRLSLRDPAQISKNASVWRDGRGFYFRSLGREICVSFPESQCSPPLPEWHCLTLLHYLDIADGTPLTGRSMPFSQYSNGMVRGGGFDRDAGESIRDSISNMDSASLAERITALGGEILPSNADLCARFDFAPCYPLWLKIWFADDEFPASGRLFVDESAGHYLTIEDAVTVGGLILEGLTDRHIL